MRVWNRLKIFWQRKEARQALSDYIASDFRTQVLNIGNGGLKVDGKKKHLNLLKITNWLLDEFGDLSKNIMFAIQKSKNTQQLQKSFDDELTNLAKKYALRESKQLEQGGKVFNNLKTLTRLSMLSFRHLCAKMMLNLSLS